MSQERTEAVVIRTVDFGETSRIVTFVCPDRGRLTCIAQGARRPKSPLRGVLDTFNRLELVYYWKEGRSVQKLAEAALLDGFPGLKGDLDKAVFAAFPLELAARVAQENEPSEDLYATLVQGLNGLERWTGPARTHVAWQVLRLLSVAGFEPYLGETDTERHRKVPFSFEVGVAEHGERPDRMASPETIETMRLMANADECPITDDAAEAFALLREFAKRHADAEFRSLRVIDQMY